LRFEDAARLRDRVEALEAAVERMRKLDRLRALETVIVVPGVEDGFRRAFFVVGGRVAAVRTLPPGAGAHVELRAGWAEARRCGEPEDAEQLLLVAEFLRRPPPELSLMAA
jgi:hypothetical protein